MAPARSATNRGSGEKAGGHGRRSPEGDPLNTPPPLLPEHLTRTETDEFLRLMTHLVTTCRSVAEQYPDGWRPPSPDRPVDFGASMALIADISRTLSRTRRGIRRISDGARYRLRAPGPPAGPPY